MGIETIGGSLLGSAGMSLVGGLLGSDAAGDAAETQANSANQANAMTERARQQMRADLSPWRTSGSQAQSKLDMLLGLVNPNQLVVRDSDGTPVANSYLYNTDPNYAKAWDAFEGSHRRQYGAGYNQASSMADINQGLTSGVGYGSDQFSKYTPQEQTGGSGYGSLLQQFTGQDLQNDPGYQFGLQQGNQALDRRAASGGNYFSGAALKAGNRYAQDYAGTKFNEAFNRDASTKNQIYSMLSGVSGMGQNAAAQTGTAGLNAANQMGQNTIGAGNALAAGQVGSANAISNGLSGALNAYQWNQILNKNSTPDWTTQGYGYGGVYSDY